MGQSVLSSLSETNLKYSIETKSLNYCNEFSELVPTKNNAIVAKLSHKLPHKN